MPPVIVAAVAIAASYGAAASAVAAGIVAAGSIGAAVIGAVAATAVSFVGNAIIASTTNQAAKQQLSNQLLTVREPVAPWPVIFGQARVGGTITFLSIGGFNDPNDNEILNAVVTIAGHQVHAITAVYFDGTPVPFDPVTGVVTSGKYAGLAGIFPYLGDPAINGYTRLAFNDPAHWTLNHRQSGRAGVYLQLFADPNAFPSGMPNVTFDILGYQAIYDPRTGTTGFTNNAALCVAAYLSDNTFGFGADPVAEFSAADLIEAANICDTIIAMPGQFSTFTADPATSQISFIFSAFINPDGTVGTVPVLGDQVQLSVVGGALPGGLSAATNYYWVPISGIFGAFVPIGKLATSLTNARAGIAVTITDTGSGVLTLTQTGQPQFLCNGAFTTDQAPVNILQSLLTSMGASASRAIWISGAWVIRAGAYRTPTVTLNESDVRRDGFKVLTTVSRRESYNSIKGVFSSPANNWQPSDFPAFTDPTYLAADNNHPSWFDLNLPFTIDPTAAQRIARMELNRSRREITVAQYPCKLTGYQVQAGDTVMVTNARLGWSSKVFDVVNAQLVMEQDQAGGMVLGCDLALREIDASAFLWDQTNAVAAKSAPRTTLPSAFYVPAAPGVPVIVEQLYVTRQNAVKSQALITAAPSTNIFVDTYQFESSPTGADDWTILGSPSTPSLTVFDIAPGIYDFRVKAIIARSGTASPYATFAMQPILGLGAPPADPTGLTGAAISGFAHLTFDPSPDLDVQIGGYGRVRWTPLQLSAAYQNGIDMGVKISPTASQVSLPLAGGTYMMKWVDSTGNESVNAAMWATNAPSVLSFANGTTVTENPTFGGSKVNCAASAGTLALTGASLVDGEANWDAIPNFDAEGGINSSGTYTFASGIDLGSVRSARMSGSVQAAVANISSNIDSRGGFVDDWLDWDGSVAAEGGAQLWIRWTDTDPTLSPTWSAWERFVIADFNHRAFQFQLSLTSLDPAYNVQVTALSATSAFN